MKPYTAPGPVLRLAGGLLFAGVIFSLAIGFLHPDGPANNHPVVFAEYAASADWIAVHVGQFVGMLVIIAGLVALFDGLSSTPAMGALTRRFGIATALIALGLYAVLQAVDGIALKRAVDAWAASPEAEKGARFASAEATRWLEEAVRSYFSLVLGLSFLSVAAVIVPTRLVPRPIGYIAGGAGLAYCAQSWLLASEGFSASNEACITGGIVLNVLWTGWLAIYCIRGRSSDSPH